MFKSKIRPVVFSQYEHGRLSGTLASLWGNEQFDRPALNFPSFVRGVALHDWAYGVVDDLPIGEAVESDWLKVIQKGVNYGLDDATSDIVAKLHLRRLLALDSSPGREALIERIDELVAVRLTEVSATRGEFERADRITRLCDMVAFDFSFEAPRQRTLPVHARRRSDKETEITYEIRPGGEVWIDPWPFAAPSIGGIVVGYALEGYPERLDPVIAPFNISGPK